MNITALHILDLNCVAYTRGAKGSLLLSEAGRADHPGYPANMVDSVGAGDAFAATLCLGLLDRHALPEINDKANRIAAFVCSQTGATPTIPKQLRESGIRVNR